MAAFQLPASTAFQRSLVSVWQAENIEADIALFNAGSSGWCSRLAMMISSSIVPHHLEIGTPMVTHFIVK